MKNASSISEFDIIRRFFSDPGYRANPSDNLVDLGVGDDCALLSIPPEQRLAISIDTLVAGRHFPEQGDAFAIGQRALAVSISDLAAMGASPLAFTLALTIPTVDQQWLQRFSQGLRSSAAHYQIPLAGGDTTNGPLSITIQVHGLLPADNSLQRRGAQPGDLIFVSGSLGDAAAALAVMNNQCPVNSEQRQYLISRFYQPEARLALGQALLNVATAAIDISDGLLADIGHIAKASSVAATIYSEKIPVSTVLSRVLDHDQVLRCALTGGDDYELCFTANARHLDLLTGYAGLFNVPITPVGEITAGEGVQCLDAQLKPLEFTVSGYQHF